MSKQELTKQELIKKYEDALELICKREDFGNFGSARKTMEYALNLARQLKEPKTNKPVKRDKSTREEKENSKLSFGEFGNVKLTKEEYEKLTKKFSLVQTTKAIESLGAYMESKKKRYASHYATLLNWVNRFAPTAQSKNEIPSPSRSYTNNEINAIFDQIKPEDI